MRIFFLCLLGISLITLSYLSYLMLGQKKLICAFMITGLANRRHFIQKTIKNFLEQDYPHKKLYILDHHTEPVEIHHPDIYYYQVQKGDKTLGILKNMIIEKIPDDSLIIPWDDDDIRDKQLLSYMYSNYIKKYKSVWLQNRIDFNLGNGFCYLTQLKKGMFTSFLVHKKYFPGYLDLQTGEDLHLPQYFDQLGGKIVLNNPSYYYIRLIHGIKGGNTSRYVQHDKDKIDQHSRIENYSEKELDTQSKKEITQIVARYMDSQKNEINQSETQLINLCIKYIKRIK